MFCVLFVVRIDFLVCHIIFLYLLFFFFKQKTAYEMRISDWSSDVCSSDLAIEEQLRAYNRLLNDRAKADEVCARLMSVPGVGPITALTYTSTIEDPHRFARSDDVGAYAGDRKSVV